MSEIIVRQGKVGDIPALLKIYNHYILNTPITFDIEPRTLSQRQEWFEQFADRGCYRCLVADLKGAAIGWACSTRFKEREAYRTSVETSVYCAPDYTGRGIGHRLYTELFQALTSEDIHRAYGGITLPNEASVGLHRALGFRHIGTQTEVGRKFSQFWDVALYERTML
jgi:phosphinothricin acetyltransferase